MGRGGSVVCLLVCLFLFFRCATRNSDNNLQYVEGGHLMEEDRSGNTSCSPARAFCDTGALPRPTIRLSYSPNDQQMA